MMLCRVRGDWTRRQSAVEAPRHPRLDPASERQQILDSILRTTRWPTTNNVAAMQDNSEQFSQPPPSSVAPEDVPEVRIPSRRITVVAHLKQLKAEDPRNILVRESQTLVLTDKYRNDCRVRARMLRRARR